MRKILILFLGMLMIGCTVQNNCNNLDKNNSSDLFEKPEYHEQIMAGDFSSIAGEYVNAVGEVKIIDEDGVHENGKIGNIEYSDGIYSMDISEQDKNDGCWYSITRFIYPVGVEVTCIYDEYTILTLNTDTSKIRFTAGHSCTLSNSRVYTKKED